MSENSLYPQYPDQKKKKPNQEIMLQQTTINYSVSWQLTQWCLYVTVLETCKIDFRSPLVQGVAFHIFHWNYYYFLVLQENFIPLDIQILH